MAISVADNFSYLGGKPLDGRIQYDTVASMKAMADAKLYEGCEAYCIETDKYYKWKSINTVDETLGKWREIESGGGSIADFTGATDQDDGAHGLVPAPQAGDEGKVLFGDGTWGNIVMPSVDYSQQSVESNIFDTNEKVIGQWIDGKLLYQKTITNTYPNTTGLTLAEKSIEHGIANIDKIINVSGFHGYNVNAVTEYIAPGNLTIMPQALHANRTYLWIRNPNQDWNGDDVFITIKYTKTTDSPLASNEKFAGLTASGEVIYKKEYINDQFEYVNSQDLNTDKELLSLSSYGKVLKYEGVVSNSSRTSFYNLPWLRQVNGALTKYAYLEFKNGTLYFTSNEGWGDGFGHYSYLRATIYYTKSS